MPGAANTSSNKRTLHEIIADAKTYGLQPTAASFPEIFTVLFSLRVILALALGIIAGVLPLQGATGVLTCVPLGGGGLRGGLPGCCCCQHTPWYLPRPLWQARPVSPYSHACIPGIA